MLRTDIRRRRQINKKHHKLHGNKEKQHLHRRRRLRHKLSGRRHTLFDIGAALATEASSRWQPAPLPQSAVDALEADIDALDSTLPRHNRFILPGGHPDAARAQIARTVARRAERRIIALNAGGITVDPEILRWINRLSDYLFVLARAINIINAHDEIFWEKGC